MTVPLISGFDIVLDGVVSLEEYRGCLNKSLDLVAPISGFLVYEMGDRSDFKLYFSG
jgi:hypothetical protein